MLRSLKGKSSTPVYVQIDIDVQRYLWRDRGVVSEHPGYKLYNKVDFFCFTTLPESWWYYLDLHRQGKSVDFPLKMKSLLSWTQIQYTKDNGMLKQAPQAPVEKVIIHFCKKACNITKLWSLLITECRATVLFIINASPIGPVPMTNWTFPRASIRISVLA